MNPLTQFKRILILPILIALALIAVAAPASATLPPGNTAAQWNTIAENTVVGSGAFQAEGYIYMAYTSAAVYNAVVAIEGGFEPYGPPITAPPGASVDCAIIEAAYRTLVNYFPSQAGNSWRALCRGALELRRLHRRWRWGHACRPDSRDEHYHLTDGRWADDPDWHNIVVSHVAASPGSVATNAAIRAAADAMGGERSPIYRAEPRPIPARSPAVASER